jgi:hypothetical protein
LTRIVAVFALLCCVAATPPTAKAGQAPPPPGAWREARGHLRLFAPEGPRAAAYRIYVSTLDVPAILTRLATDPSLLHPPGAWSPAALLPLDAFGQTGGYDRSRLARLYGSTRPIVVRGPRGTAGRPTEAWTLISPYPDRDLERLEPGTMLIVLALGERGAP